jgi:hypothetical protein
MPRIKMHEKKLPLLRQALQDPTFASFLESWGAEQGYMERADIVFQTLDGADLNRMWNEFMETLRIRKEQRDRLIDMFIYPVNDVVEQIRYPVENDFEEASEYGVPKSQRMGPPFTVGFDYRDYDLAQRFTWMFLRDSTQAQIEALHAEALDADNRLIFNKVFKTLFNPTNVLSSMRDIPVTMYKFWNGDGTVPPKFKTTTHTGTHTHYLTTASASITSASLTAVEDHLYHHGYSIFNGYKLVILCNRQEGKVFRTLKVSGGFAYDFIPNNNVGGGLFLPANSGIIGTPPEPPMTGEIGSYGPFHIVEEDYVPAGYFVALASGGPANLRNPIGFREHANPSFRGLQLIPGPRANNYPLIESYYTHGFGTGIRQRGAGVITQVTVSGTYTVPAIYA